MIQQHVWTTFNLAQAFVPHLVANGWGRFLVISSPRALEPRGSSAAYAIGKAGEEILTLSLAQELKGTGVTANVLLVRSIDVKHMRARRLRLRQQPLRRLRPRQHRAAPEDAGGIDFIRDLLRLCSPWMPDSSPDRLF